MNPFDAILWIFALVAAAALVLLGADLFLARRETHAWREEMDGWRALVDERLVTLLLALRGHAAPAAAAPIAAAAEPSATTRDEHPGAPRLAPPPPRLPRELATPAEPRARDMTPGPRAERPARDEARRVAEITGGPNAERGEDVARFAAEGEAVEDLTLPRATLPDLKPMPPAEPHPDDRDSEEPVARALSSRPGPLKEAGPGDDPEERREGIYERYKPPKDKPKG